MVLELLLHIYTANHEAKDCSQTAFNASLAQGNVTYVHDIKLSQDTAIVCDVSQIRQDAIKHMYFVCR